MLDLLRNTRLLRLITLFTVAAFLPSAAGAWNFVEVHVTAPLKADETPSPWTKLPWETGQAGGQLPWQDAFGLLQPFRLAENASPSVDILDREQMSAIATAAEKPEPPRPKPISLAALEAGGMPASSIPPTKENAEKILLAQASPSLTVAPVNSYTVAQSPLDAQSMLEDAARMDAAGDPIGAALTYLGVLDSYSHTNICLAARDGIGSLASRMAAGEFSAAALQEFTRRLPAFDSLKSTESRYAVLDFYDMQAHPAEVGGDRETALAADRLIRAGAHSAMLQDMNHPLQVDIVFKYYDTCEFESRQTHLEGVSELGNVINSSPPCMTTWAAKFWLAKYFDRLGNDPNTAKLYYRQVINDLGKGFVQNALNDPAAYAWVQATIEWMIADAYHSVNDYATAVSYYQHCLNTYGRSVSREIHDHASLGLTYASISLGEVSPTTIVQALYNHLQTYPENFFNSTVHLELANTYNKYEMYDDAIAAYEQIVQKYPNTNAARAAQSELDYVYTNVVGTVQVAKKESGISAQMCGPIALAKLLKAQGVDVSADELAKLAGTDATGTTMLGLVEAAKAKGIEITGVRAASLMSLKTPFIAHVNGDHFVVVRQVENDKVVLDDADNATQTESIAQFGARWQGNAIILGSAESVTKPLEVASLRNVKGGHYPGGTHNGQNQDQDPPEPPPSDTCPSDEQGQGDGNGAGTCPSCDSGGSSSHPTGGTVTSPWALTGVSSPGVHPIINVSTLGLYLTETDISMPIRGGVLAFRRAYTSDAGYHNAGYTDVNKTYSNNIGSGWTHNWNIHLRSDAATNPLYTGCWGGRGRVIEYERANTSTALFSASCVYYDHFLCRQNMAALAEPFQQVPGTNKLLWDELNGHRYQFSVPDNSADHFSYLESVTDLSGNAFSLSYNGSGRLTKVTAPITGYSLNFSYSGNLITKVELKKTGITSALETVLYAYNTSNELTKVTDNDGNYVTYTYATDTNATGSRFIDSITDKMGNVTTLTYTFAAGTDRWEAQKLEFVNAENMKTVYDRSLSTGACTITNVDGTTVLSKMVHTPVTDDFVRTKYKDYYTDATNYERWEYLYDSNGWLTQIKEPSTATYMTYSYTSNGRLSTEATGTGPTTDYDYATNGTKPTKITGPDGTAKDLYYDSSGRLTKTVHPSTNSNGLRYFYDSAGQVTKVTDPLGNDMTFAFDSNGRMTSRTDALTHTTTFAYDDRGNVTQVTDPNNHSTYFYYATGSCQTCGGGGRLTKITDAENNDTNFYYDVNGNQTKITDALSRDTTFDFDLIGRMTAQTQGTATTYFGYDRLNHLTTVTDANGNDTVYSYNFRGRLTTVSDPVADVSYGYDAVGQQTSITDGLNHTTTYAYDGAYRLTSVTDAISKSTKYFYDSLGHMTKVGAGSSGTTDPTEYFYSTTTGLLTKVSYTSGSNTYDANYYYDGLARLTKLTDWINSTNWTDYVDGLRYGYDAAGQLTQITDYDDSYLTYAYDAAGLVTTMMDYHGNSTTYTYTAANQLSTLTAPGSRTWDYDYNAIGQPTHVSIPNGMATDYGYDTRNRLTAIEHKDGTTVLDGFYYDLDAVGNITKTTNEDSSYWNYGYDDRYRLTTANRYNATGHIKAAYTYTYDDGDNMITKVEPFFDDFNDGNYTGWSVSGTMTASSNYLASTGTGAPVASISNTDADNETVLRYRIEDTSDSLTRCYLIYRFTDWNNYEWVRIFPSSINIGKNVSGTGTQIVSGSATSTANTWYNLRIVADGTSVKVYRWADGAMPSLICSTTSSPNQSTSSFKISIGTGYLFDFDDIHILADSISNTTTFAVNNANELTSTSDFNGTTTFGYDAWGRMTTKARGSYSATYDWRYGYKLYSVASSFPGEGNVTYQYGGDEKRRARTVGSATTRYNWNRGWNVVSELTSSGALATTYVHDASQAIGTVLAELVGTNPATATPRYYSQDNIGSTRRLRDSGKNSLAQYDYQPYGADYAASGLAVTHKFTGHDLDTTGSLYYAPHRYYAPTLTRWILRDPLHMQDGPNVFAYTRNNPISHTDPLGLVTRADCENALGACLQDCRDKYCTGPYNPLQKTALAICQAKCYAIYQACLAKVKFEELVDYCSENPGVCILGAIIVIGGVAYIVSTGGSGALILIPATI